MLTTVIRAVAVVVAVAVVMAAPAAAAPGTSSIALEQIAPRYGDFVSFEIATTETEGPFVNLKCYQGGELIYDGWASYFDGHERSFGLASQSWGSGAANCEARLTMWHHGRNKVLAAVGFHVAA